MMKEEFDAMVGFCTEPTAYERIEFVYMNSDKFQTKGDIVKFYKEKDMNGIESEYRNIMDSLNHKAEFKAFLEDMAYYSRDLNNSIKQFLAANLHTFFQNKTLVHMLNEYRTRDQKEFKHLVREFEWVVENPDKKNEWSSNSLTHAKSYRDVIADLTYEKWWSEHAQDNK